VTGGVTRGSLDELLNRLTPRDWDLPIGEVTLPATDVLALLKLAELHERHRIATWTPGERGDLATLFEDAREELRSKADWCEACQVARNEPDVYRRARACEGCEDGSGHSWGPSDA
jgi:hypothetical protein